jgi:hypothetical protein
MTLSKLTENEREIVRNVMAATFDYFTSDFGTRLGIEQRKMRKLLVAWPHVDDTRDDSDACLAINNSLNEILNGIGISDEQASKTFGVSRTELERVYTKWAFERGWQPPE